MRCTYQLTSFLKRNANTNRSPHLDDDGYTADNSSELEEDEEDESEDDDPEPGSSKDEADHKNK